MAIGPQENEITHRLRKNSEERKRPLKKNKDKLRMDGSKNGRADRKSK